MKKILICLASFALAVSAIAQQSWQYFATNTESSGVYLLLTNRVNIGQVQVITTNAQAEVYLYNQNLLSDPYNGTNVVIPSYVSRGSYATNELTEYVDPTTGYTNSYTNYYVYTYNVTNAQATNALPPAGAFGATMYTPGNFDNLHLLMERGVVVRVVGDGTTVILKYNTAGL